MSACCAKQEHVGKGKGAIFRSQKIFLDQGQLVAIKLSFPWGCTKKKLNICEKIKRGSFFTFNTFMCLILNLDVTPICNPTSGENLSYRLTSI